MAETYTKEELIEIYRGLPEQVKDAIFSPETTDIFDAIKEKQALTDEQREIMSVYTGFLMMGVLPPEKYMPTLIEKMNIDREKAASIAQEINRDLFNPIKDVLKEVHATQKSTPETVVAPAPQLVFTPPTETDLNIAAAPATEAPSSAAVTPRATPMMMPSPSMPSNTPIMQTKPTLVVPPPPLNIPPTVVPQETQNAPVTSGDQGGVTQPHIGSIFEQKLGGEFRLKSDAVAYTNQPVAENNVITPSAPNV